MDPTVAFLLQLALILGAARLFGELLKRCNQPPVLGELLAGILLGPSVLGWAAPELFTSIFSNTAQLTSVSTVGLILLMLLTGLETDIQVMRNMGRASFAASVFGMLIPFCSGLGLGMLLDDSFVPASGRPLLALFLATAMAISAMPVIAKILLDLNMMRRNFGIVILSSAVVDDTVGWIILAFISGMVTQKSLDLAPFMQTLGWLCVFLLGSRYVIYPGLRRLIPQAQHELRMPGGELVLIVVFTLLMGAATEAMHVHAVFGAFIAGVILRQCSLRAEEIHRLEGVTMALFAPLFFGAVGLRVDFTTLQSFWLPILVLIVAIAGKVIGCFIGGLIGRMPPWEAFALGLGMSARGAMGLVVASIGLQLGILNAELFAIIVLMAIMTSFIAPISLKAIAHKLPLSEEERLREKSVAAGGFIPSGQLRILIPAAGGSNAVIGCHLAAHLCSAENDRSAALFIETEKPGWLGFFRRSRSHVDTKAYFERLKQAAGNFAARLSVRQVPTTGTVLETILQEAAKGYQFIFIGASGHGHPLYDPFISGMVSAAPCHIVVVSGTAAVAAEPKPFQRILVPTNGSYYADAAFEFAAQYAAATNAHVTVLYVAEGHQRNPLLPAAALTDVSDHTQDVMRVTLKQQFSERMKDPSKLDCQVRESETVLSALKEEVLSGNYDLVVFGAENKSLVERLYLGHHIETALTEVEASIAVVIPKVGSRLGRA